MSDINPLKRNNPFGGYDASANQRSRNEPQTPQQIVDGWISRLHRASLAGHPRAQDVLQHIAEGRVLSMSAAVWVLNGLFAAGEYEVFADVFTAWVDTWKADRARYQPDSDQPVPPFESVWTLALPRDWVCHDPDKMAQVFSKIPLDILEVKGHDEDGLVAAAVSTCVVAALNHGLKKLVVAGYLEAPEPVAQAIRGSQLEWFQLRLQSPILSQISVESQKTLLSGVAACASLTHLHLDGAVIMGLLPTIQAFQQPGGPELKAVSVTCHTIDPMTALVVRDFMTLVARFPTLSTVIAWYECDNVELLQTAFFGPLSGHASLDKLRLLGGRVAFDVNIQSLCMLPNLADFIHSCPRLEVLHLYSATPSFNGVKTMVQLQAQGGNLQIKEALKSLPTVIGNPSSRLRELRVSGLCIPAVVLDVCARSLPNNTSIEILDLQGCLLDLPATLLLPEALDRNTTLKELGLPRDPEYYHMVTWEGRLYAFAREAMAPADGGPQRGQARGDFRVAEDADAGAVNMLDQHDWDAIIDDGNDSDSGSWDLHAGVPAEPLPLPLPLPSPAAPFTAPAPPPFVLQFDHTVSAADRKTATQQFEPFEHQANQLQATVQAKLSRNLQKVLGKQAHPALVQNVADFMATAYASSAFNAPPLDPERDARGFSLQATTVVDIFQQEGYLSSALTMAQLNRATQRLHRTRQQQAKALQTAESIAAADTALQQLVAIQRAENSSRRRTSAASLEAVVNEKDERGANRLLLKAVLEGNVPLVYTLKARRARDFGDHARVAAGASEELLAALDHNPDYVAPPPFEWDLEPLDDVGNLDFDPGAPASLRMQDQKPPEG